MSKNERIFRWLLRLYPGWFRRRYEGDLMAFFRRDRAHARWSGRLGGLRFWVHTVGDLVPAALSKRFTKSVAGAEARPTGSPRFAYALVHDARGAFKALRREPGFAAVSVATLGLGIGAATVVFTIVNGVLLAPLPYPEPDRLVRVYERERDNANARMVAYGNYAELRESGSMFDELAIWAYSAHTLTGVDRAQRLLTREVSANFARTMQVSPILGRWIAPDEERDGTRVVVISAGVWERSLGADSGIVGTAVRLDDSPYTVVGVMPAGFDFPFGADAWVPLAPVTNPNGLRRWHRHNMVGRLADGVSFETAQVGLDPIAFRMARDYPETNEGNYFELETLLDTYVGATRGTLTVLFAAVLALLLIACVNIASLVLARATSRTRELAVRSALGANRMRLASLLVAESVTIGLLGGVAGLGLSVYGVRAVLTLDGGSIPRTADIAVTAPVFGFVAAASIITGLLVSLLPLLTRREGAVAHLTGAGRSSASRRAVRSRRALVGAQLSVALMLVTGAGLMIQSLSRLTAIDPGVDTTNLLSFNLRLASGRYPEQVVVARFVEDLTARMEAVPGVARAAVVLTPPVTNTGWFNSLTIRDRPVGDDDAPPIGYNVTSSGYFEALGVPVLEGRVYGPADVDGVEHVVVINRAAAERHWPSESPIGKYILGSDTMERPYARIIGIVDDIRQSLFEPTGPEVYVPVSQDRVLSFVAVVRADGDPTALAPAIRSVVEAADRDIPITRMETLAERIGQNTAQPRFSAVLMTAFAALALALACVGVYGVLSYSVAERRREFGIRMAVGADSGKVLAQVIREAGMLAIVSVAAGLGGTVVLSGLTRSLLFEVSPTNPVTLLAAGVLVGGLAIVAAVVPARQATGVDAVVVLREE